MTRYFVLGVICTLAVIYPAATKNILGIAVDTVHNVTVAAMEKSSEAKTN